MKKLIFDKHYVNKSHTKHYFMGHIFDNFEWDEFIHGIRIQNITIGINSKYRVVSEQCERWFNQDNNSAKIVKRCQNKTFYRSITGGYFCKQCAREISKINNNAEFVKIKEIK